MADRNTARGRAYSLLRQHMQSRLSLDDLVNIDRLLENGVQSFTLTGGEPLTRLDLKDIIKYIAAQNIPMVMISNGRAMDDNFLDFISRYDVTLCISIPGIQTF